MKTAFVISLFRVVNLCYGQHADTTIHKRHYSVCCYYPGMYERIGLETDEPKILFSLGNYQDTVKAGHWLDFFASGQLLAEGDSDKGIKQGNWKYYSGNGDYSVVKFSAKIPTIERIHFTASSYAEIYDYLPADTHKKLSLIHI